MHIKNDHTWRSKSRWNAAPTIANTIMTWMVTESGGRWHIRVAQNTNLGIATEP